MAVSTGAGCGEVTNPACRLSYKVFDWTYYQLASLLTHLLTDLTTKR